MFYSSLSRALIQITVCLSTLWVVQLQTILTALQNRCISNQLILHDFDEALQRSPSKAAGSAESAPDRPRKQR